MDWIFFWNLLKGVFWNTKNWVFSVPAYLSILALILYIWPRHEQEGWKMKVLQILREYPGLIIMGLLLVSVIATSYSL